MIQPIFTGIWGKGHIQGIAVDQKKGYLYYSFTTKLIKATLDGTPVACIDGLIGHLGCIAFNEEDGRVYGSLEYKSDSIGKGILDALEIAERPQDGFYVAVFDVDKMDRMDMNAERDEVMTAVYIREAVADYTAPGHRYGCSGIDGITFGPMPGEPKGKKYLFLAYGIYGDTTRDDNDHQVLLCYDTADWKSFEAPLDQKKMHQSGPDTYAGKFFVYTGNTCYGVQNLEYDAAQQAFFMAVYPGKKPQFPNYRMFAVDATVAPKDEKLSLKPIGKYHAETGIYGWMFAHGSTGLYSYGNGEWLISENHRAQSGQCSFLYRYVFENDEFLLKN